MLVASLLFYKKFCGDLENIVFGFNPYDEFVSNRINVGKQHTVRFHVENVISSNANTKVNDKFTERMNRKYVKHGEVKASRGKIH